MRYKIIVTPIAMAFNRALNFPTINNSKLNAIIYNPIFLLIAAHSDNTKKPMRNLGSLNFSSLESTSLMNIRDHAKKKTTCVMSFDIDANIIGKTGKKHKNIVHTLSGTRCRPRSLR